MPKIVHRMARFIVVGIVATLTHMSLFTLGFEVAHLEPVLANGVAFCLAVLLGFSLNRRWTFSEHSEHGRLWRYFATALVGLGVNSTAMYLVTHVLRLSPYIGLVLAIMCVPPITFTLNQFWVFRPRPSR